jgi:chromosome segregation protein
LERLQAQVTRRYQEKSRLEHDLENAKTTEATCRSEIEALYRRREQLDEKLAAERETSSELHEEQRTVESRSRGLRDDYTHFQSAKSKHSIEAERLRAALEGIIVQATEKYQVDIKSWPVPEDPDFNTEKTSREVNRIRREIEEIGPVNMVAIEEYDALSQRYTFTTTQRDEIQSSIGVIEGAIAEIDITARDRFLATYEVIHKNFSELFPILFPGGEARLELGSVEDPLNTTVEIMVRLPGKKQQRMSLFSGGEKALTAISLIFALLKTKPTPFCFLDEVDAPLDEANVGRYNAVLEALSSRFQFIVITHNRRTMEVLDQLYGVTMQEGGVSKVVGVDLKKDLPAHLQKAFKEEKAKGRIIEGATAVPPESIELEAEIT